MNIAYFIRPKSKTAFIYDTSTLRQGIERMKHHGYAAIPVLTKDGRYFGRVTEGDFLWHTYGNDDPKSEEKIRISEIIRPDKTEPLNLRASMQEMLLKAMEQNFVPVVDDRGYFVGLITRKDVMRYYLNRYFPIENEEQDWKAPSEDFVSPVSPVAATNSNEENGV